MGKGRDYHLEKADMVASLKQMDRACGRVHLNMEAKFGSLIKIYGKLRPSTVCHPERY